MTGMASSARTRRLTGARRHAAATLTSTAAISRSAGRPATLPPTLNPPRISAPAPTRAVPLRVSRARPRSGPGESSSATAAVQESRTVKATAGSAYPAKAGTAPATVQHHPGADPQRAADEVGAVGGALAEAQRPGHLLGRPDLRVTVGGEQHADHLLGVVAPVVFGVQGKQPPVPLLHPAAPGRGPPHPVSPAHSQDNSCSLIRSLRPGPDG